MDKEDFTAETLPSQTKLFCDISSWKKDENNFVTPSEEFSIDASSVELKKKQIDIYHEVERDFHLFIYGVSCIIYVHQRPHYLHLSAWIICFSLY